MNNRQYTKYLFEKIQSLSNANPGVTRETYGKGENSTHVLNAISPAFTASFALADVIIERSNFWR